MYELWQTEWCPASRRVRQRLTELGIDYLTRQVPVERDERTLLRVRTGTDTIPVLVAPTGAVLVGEDAITTTWTRTWLSQRSARASAEGGKSTPPLGRSQSLASPGHVEGIHDRHLLQIGRSSFRQPRRNFNNRQQTGAQGRST